MEKIEIKSLLIEACRKKLLDTIAQLEATIADAQQQANDYGPPKDRYDSFRSQLMRRRDMMAQQLSKEMIEMQVLNKVDLRIQCDSVGFGAVVNTTDQNYFISIGLGKIELGEETYYAISPVVPLSQVIAGKKKGEIAEFRGKKIEITCVF